MTAALNGLCEVYPERGVLEDNTVRCYFDALQRYSIDSVIRACREHMGHPSRARWFPKPGELRRCIEERHPTESYQVKRDPVELTRLDYQTGGRLSQLTRKATARYLPILKSEGREAVRRQWQADMAKAGRGEKLEIEDD